MIEDITPEREALYANIPGEMRGVKLQSILLVVETPETIESTKEDMGRVAVSDAIFRPMVAAIVENHPLVTEAHHTKREDR